MEGVCGEEEVQEENGGQVVEVLPAEGDEERSERVACHNDEFKQNKDKKWRFAEDRNRGGENSIGVRETDKEFGGEPVEKT